MPTDVFAQQLRVLVVDDDRQMRQVVATIFGPFGKVRLLDASNANDAWRIVCQQNLDLILLDWHMPSVDGVLFARRLRTDQSTPNASCPVILMTAEPSASVVSKARDAGVDEIVVKPFSPKSLMDKVIQTLSDRRPLVVSPRYRGPDRRRRDAGFEGPDRRRTTRD